MKNERTGSRLPVLGLTHILAFPTALARGRWIDNSPAVSRAVSVLVLLYFGKGEWDTGITTARFNSHWAQPLHLQSQSVRGPRNMKRSCRGLLLPPAWLICLSSASTELCIFVPNDLIAVFRDSGLWNNYVWFIIVEQNVNWTLLWRISYLTLVQTFRNIRNIWMFGTSWVFVFWKWSGNVTVLKAVVAAVAISGL